MAIDDKTLAARLGRGALLSIAAGVLAASLTGCSLLSGDKGTGAGPSGSGGLGEAAVDSTPSAVPAKPAGDKGDGGTGTGSGSGSGTSGDGGGTGNGHTATQPAGPHIVYFRVAQQPSCPQGTNLHTVPGKPLVIEWKVTGATQVELAVDGPGAYNTYGAQGSETFMFSCNGAPGRVETHTYKITTIGGGHARTKTISASATVKEIAMVDNSTPAPGQ
jgi:hypothetical protein